MNNFDRAQRDWETPPDEMNAQFCDSCGIQMELVLGNISLGDEFVCENAYCPDKFDDDVSRAMALHILELQDTVERLNLKINFLMTRNQNENS